MNRVTTSIALSIGLAAGCVLAAAPNYAALNSNSANARAASRPAPEIVAEDNDAQEQRLMQQIESDSARLKADEAAEQAGQQSANPQRRWIRAALLHLHDALNEIHRTSDHYSGHRRAAVRAIYEARSHLMACYKIDSAQR
jgi:hypothetical protein